MFDYQLFLGLPVSPLYQQELLLIPKSITDIFIQNQTSPYLQQIENDGTTYLGKSLGSLIELSSLDALQIHIYSILRKLIPDFPYEEHSLVLFAFQPI